LFQKKSMVSTKNSHRLHKLYSREQSVEVRTSEILVAADAAIAGTFGLVQLDANVLDPGQRNASQVSNVSDGALLISVRLHTRTEGQLHARGRLNALIRDDLVHSGNRCRLRLRLGFGFRFRLGLGLGFVFGFRRKLLADGVGGDNALGLGGHCGLLRHHRVHGRGVFVVSHVRLHLALACTRAEHNQQHYDDDHHNNRPGTADTDACTDRDSVLVGNVDVAAVAIPCEP